MPNKKACKNRLLLRRDSRNAVFKDCFAAVLSVSGLLVTGSTGFCQSGQALPHRAMHEDVYRPSASPTALPSTSNYLPASPWSKQVSYEQTYAPEQIEAQPSPVLKQPIRRPLPAKVVDRPAGLTWGRIREIQPQEGVESESRSQSGTIELADVPSVGQTAKSSSVEPNQMLEVIPPVGSDSRVAEVDQKVLLQTTQADTNGADEPGIFLVPSSPQELAVESRGVGQFASTRETMTRSKPFQLPSEPEPIPSTTLAPPSFQEAERMRIAQMQSHELQSIPLEPVYSEPRLLESPVGWKAIRGELAKHLENCDSLLKRGATHSARAEVLVGLRKLFRVMDLHRGVTHSETCFEAALTAMREEADFHNLQMSRSVASIVAMHTTPALKNRPLESVTTELACQHYRAYARFQMTQAADGHLYAADLMYALGKTLEKDADLNADRAQQLRSQAVICYQSAIQLRPNQHHASNQLGYTLIHLDRIEEAYDALRASIEVKPNAPAWTNLAEIYRRRGATTEANYAVQQAMALGGGEPAEQLDITQVDPAVFAKFSPAHNANSAPASTASQATSQGPAYQQTAKAGNFFTKMFR
jgi:tetratricopeptide (TPR) repeat protein